MADVTEDNNKLKKRGFIDDLAVLNVNEQFNNWVEIIDKVRCDQANVSQNEAEQKIFTEIDLTVNEVEFLE